MEHWEWERSRRARRRQRRMFSHGSSPREFPAGSPKHQGRDRRRGKTSPKAFLKTLREPLRLRSHLFPRISPGKTTAGCVGSFVGATAVGGVLYATHVLPDCRFGILGALVGAALVNLAAQAGDLFESWVKRRAGVKDSSAVFGPSGGLLDQIDSLLFTVPMAALTWPWLFAITR